MRADNFRSILLKQVKGGRWWENG